MLKLRQNRKPETSTERLQEMKKQLIQMIRDLRLTCGYSDPIEGGCGGCQTMGRLLNSINAIHSIVEQRTLLGKTMTEWQDEQLGKDTHLESCEWSKGGTFCTCARERFLDGKKVEPTAILFGVPLP